MNAFGCVAKDQFPEAYEGIAGHLVTHAVISQRYFLACGNISHLNNVSFRRTK
jgi:hypothetical protein